MIEELTRLYGIKIKTIIKKTNKVYLVYGDNFEYVLKKQENKLLENIFSRLSLLNLDLFGLPLKNRMNQYISIINGEYYYLEDLYLNEDVEAKDIKINFYINAIARLHDETKYYIKVNDGFFKESITYLDSKISKVKEELFSRIERVEKEPYHSPSDWFFLMNYPILYNAIREADRYVSLLENEWEEVKDIRLSLVYLNFSYDHILPKSGKIISLDKVNYAPSIYDLVTLIENLQNDNIDVTRSLKQYSSIHSLEKYEIYWLLSFLYIIKINRYINQFEDILSLTKTLDFINIVNELASNFFEEDS